SKLREPAEVIAVPVRDNQMVDLLKPGVFSGRHDATGVTNGARSNIACVHEQRFPGGRDEERGIAALDVNYIDSERLAGLGLRNGDRSGKGESRNYHDYAAHQIRSL